MCSSMPRSCKAFALVQIQTWLSMIPSLGDQFCMTSKVRRDDQRFKAAVAGRPRHYSTQLFKQLIVRQRRLQQALCGPYEQTVDDVYLRLPQLATKGVWLGERERESKQRRGRRERTKGRQLNTLVIKQTLLFACLLGVTEEWKNAAFRSE